MQRSLPPAQMGSGRNPLQHRTVHVPALRLLGPALLLRGRGTHGEACLDASTVSRDAMRSGVRPSEGDQRRNTKRPPTPRRYPEMQGEAAFDPSTASRDARGSGSRPFEGVFRRSSLRFSTLRERFRAQAEAPWGASAASKALAFTRSRALRGAAWARPERQTPGKRLNGARALVVASPTRVTLYAPR
jgi:hypothetical protein